MRMTRLRQLRESRGLTREELAVKAHVSWLTIRSHELGLVNGTETKTAEAIAGALGVDVIELFAAPSTGLGITQENSPAGEAA
jgi:DNA-binding XRE family transcriptional regulator